MPGADRELKEIVRTPFLKTITVCLIAFSFVYANDITTSTIRLGVLKLETSGISAKASAELDDTLCNIISSLGFYKVYSHKKMEARLVQIKHEIPTDCRPLQCAIEIGERLDLDQILFGRIDRNKKSTEVSFSLVDVKSKVVVNTFSMQDTNRVLIERLLRIAIMRMHGMEFPEIQKVPAMCEQEIHNEKIFYAASGLCVGIGLLWAALNGGLFDSHITEQFDTRSLSNISSSTLQIPFFGRPTALGDAYVAAASDAYGVIYNPAGMAWVTGPEVATGYQYSFSMLNNVVASYVNKATNEIGFGECLLYSGDMDHLQNELHFISAYSYKFNHPFLLPRPVSVGVSVKLSTITSPESENATASQKTFEGGLDFGIMTELNDNIRLAGVLSDAPSIRKVNNTTTGSRYLEYDPMRLQIGGTFQPGSSTFLICQSQIPLFQDQYWAFSGGIEQALFRFFKLRLGLEKQIYLESPWLFTGGFGVKVDTKFLAGKYLVVDASYQYSTVEMFPSANASFKIGF